MQKDAIIVLGSGISSEGQLFLNGKQRVEKGVELYKENHAPRIIMSGGVSWHRDDAPARTEAKAMREFAVSLGVPDKQVFLEEHSKDTLGNIFFAKIEYLAPRKWHDIVVVTSHYHVERVQYLCQKVLGRNYVYTVEGVEAGLSPDELEKRVEQEKKKFAFAREHLAQIKDGDDAQIREIILNKHPSYREDTLLKEWLMQMNE